MRSKSPFILYVTGQSAAGKSTLHKSIARWAARQSSIAVHDIDENGVPDYGRPSWRLYRIDELLGDARDRFAKGKSTIICGITLPHEVIESECYLPSLKIYFLMLKITQREFLRRIVPRLKRQGEMHLLPELKRSNNELSKKLYHQVLTQQHKLILDGVRLSKSEILARTWDYIDRIRSGALSFNTKGTTDTKDQI